MVIISDAFMESVISKYVTRFNWRKKRQALYSVKYVRSGEKCIWVVKLIQVQNDIFKNTSILELYLDFGLWRCMLIGI